MKKISLTMVWGEEKIFKIRSVKTAIQAYQNSSVSKFKRTKIRAYQNSSVPKFKHNKIQAYQNLSVPKFEKYLII